MSGPGPLALRAAAVRALVVGARITLATGWTPQGLPASTVDATVLQIDSGLGVVLAVFDDVVPAVWNSSGVPMRSGWVDWSKVWRVHLKGEPAERHEFLGFCTPCGGLRRHKLGCPVARAGADSARAR